MITPVVVLLVGGAMLVAAMAMSIGRSSGVPAVARIFFSLIVWWLLVFPACVVAMFALQTLFD